MLWSDDALSAKKLNVIQKGRSSDFRIIPPTRLPIRRGRMFRTASEQ
jgi:hypothetical protein